MNKVNYYFEQHYDKIGRPIVRYLVYDRASMYHNTSTIAMFYNKEYAERFVDMLNQEDKR